MHRTLVASSLLFLFVLVFGAEPSFGPTCLMCLHSLDLLSSLFALFFFLVFLLVWCFFYGFWLIFSFFNSCRHLEIVIP